MDIELEKIKDKLMTLNESLPSLNKEDYSELVKYYMELDGYSDDMENYDISNDLEKYDTIDEIITDIKLSKNSINLTDIIDYGYMLTEIQGYHGDYYELISELKGGYMPRESNSLSIMGKIIINKFTKVINEVSFKPDIFKINNKVYLNGKYSVYKGIIDFEGETGNTILIEMLKGIFNLIFSSSLRLPGTKGATVTYENIYRGAIMINNLVEVHDERKKLKEQTKLMIEHVKVKGYITYPELDYLNSIIVEMLRLYGKYVDSCRTDFMEDDRNNRRDLNSNLFKVYVSLLLIVKKYPEVYKVNEEK